MGRNQESPVYALTVIDLAGEFWSAGRVVVRGRTPAMAH